MQFFQWPYNVGINGNSGFAANFVETSLLVVQLLSAKYKHIYIVVNVFMRQGVQMHSPAKHEKYDSLQNPFQQYPPLLLS